MDYSTKPEMFMTGTVRVVKDGKPLSGADIVLYDQVRSTDSNGVAQFEHVMTGHANIRVITNGTEYDQTVTISQPDTSISLTGPGTTYIKSNAVAPSFNRDMMMDQMKNVAAQDNGGYILIGGTIFILLVLVLAAKFFFPAVMKKIFGKKHAKKIVFLGITLALLLTAISATSKPPAPAQAATNSTLRVPQDVRSYPDDQVAILTWDTFSSTKQTRGQMIDEDQSRGIYGYYIEWAKESLGFSTSTKMITEYRWAQLQPLQNGVNYIARIYAIDKNGDVSSPSQTITFTGSNTRVEALRPQMNGFFDDFNRPQGAFDELKWNMSYSGCVSEGLGGQFINSQYHAHNAAYAGNCDRGMSISRPRKILDFRNRTATITFDLDGTAGHRTKWYLDVLGITADVKADAPIDITSRIADNTGDIAHPGNILRIRQYGSGIEVLKVGANGEATLLNTIQQAGANSCDNWGYTPLDFCKSSENKVPLETTPNFRRKWKILLSKSKIDIYIDNTHAYSANLNLPFETAYLHWLLFTYNTPKENRPMELIHWDNFGFDAPAVDLQQDIVTHNYTDGLVGTKEVNGKSLPHSEAQASPPQLLTVTVPIPDQIKDNAGANPTAARLMFTLQGYNNNSFNWSATDNVTVNGTKYLIPEPVSATGMAQVVSDYQPFSMVIPINAAALKTGNNDLVFTIQRSGIFNVHIELDYPKTTAPSYTQPNQIHANYDQTVIPRIADIGPGVVIGSINNTVTWDKISHDGFGASSSFIGTFAGTININYDAYSSPSEVGNGRNYGIRAIELLVDKGIKSTINTSSQVPVAIMSDTFAFDTTTLCNGRHELYVRAFNGNGTTSVADYFEVTTFQGEYFPMLINTNNPGKPACTGTYIPVATPIPYITAPPPAPTGEHQPGPTTQSISLIMYQQNNSGQQGTVTFTAKSSTSTDVSINIPSLTYSNQPAHIHTGTCAAPGPVVFTLSNVNAGQSVTTVNASYFDLFRSGYIVNVHKSTTESGVYTSCTQIVDPNATTPSPTPSVGAPTATPVPSSTSMPTATPIIPSSTGIMTATPIAATNTPPPGGCPLKPKGDADCDGFINAVDYVIWRTQYFAGTTIFPDITENADFNGDNKVNLVDLQIWVENVY